jgi:hypothetical protein
VVIDIVRFLLGDDSPKSSTAKTLPQFMRLIVSVLSVGRGDYQRQVKLIGYPRPAATGENGKSDQTGSLGRVVGQ